jgi:hypothetical protein
LSSCWKQRFFLGGKILLLGNKQKNGTVICTKDFHEKKWPNFTIFIEGLLFPYPPFFCKLKKIIGMRKHNALPYSKESEKKLKQHQYGDNPFVKSTTKTHL